jgi:hypothetical protein
MKGGEVLKNLRRTHRFALLFSLLSGSVLFFIFRFRQTPFLHEELHEADRILQFVLVGLYALAYLIVYRLHFNKRISGLRRSTMAAVEKLEVFRKAIVPLWICLSLLCLFCWLAFAGTLNLAYVLLGLTTLFFIWLLVPAPARVSIILGETEQTLKEL